MRQMQTSLTKTRVQTIMPTFLVTHTTDSPPSSDEGGNYPRSFPGSAEDSDEEFEGWDYPRLDVTQHSSDEEAPGYESRESLGFWTMIEEQVRAEQVERAQTRADIAGYGKGSGNATRLGIDGGHGCS